MTSISIFVLISTVLLMILPGFVITQNCQAPQSLNYSEAIIDVLGGLSQGAEKLINTTVWPGDATEPGFIFPELSDGPFGIPALQKKANIGIGVSGGGLRAVFLGLGYLRGMHMLGLLNKARYLGGASGGSFVVALTSYTDPMKLSKNLGNYVPPHLLTPEQITASIGGKGTFMYELSQMDPTFYQRYLEIFARPDNYYVASKTHPQRESGFARVLAMAAFNNIKAGGKGNSKMPLGQFNSTVTSLGTRGKIHKKIKEAAKMLGLEVYVTDSTQVPFPLILSNIYDPTVANFEFTPLEFTPLYSGVPLGLNGTSPYYGQGLVEPLGFNGQVVAHPDGPAQAEDTITVKSLFIQPLVGKLASSGSLLAVVLNGFIDASRGVGVNNSIASLSEYYQIYNLYDYTSKRFPIADGGYTDNEGLIAMLRRKVSKILIFYSIASSSTDKAVWSANNSGLSQPFGLCQNCYTNLTPSIADDVINNISKVFNQSEKFDDLFNTYHKNLCAGKVNTWRSKLQVVENKFLGVPGGWEVDLLVVMNAPIKDWEDKLPPATKELLKKSRDDPSYLAQAATDPLSTHALVGFPLFDILVFNYKPEAAGALGSIATWSVLELNKTMSDFMQSP
ncbi:hypothetical protein CEUSTIGMA_g12122.t1 [Chlamydomonas eustigma]|uniref:Uncharacterized protein n=1 Tax=Chlamydomonas eustigma TaxID=1157962 RepID=A0A250XPH3_9CHLO|nr:hypothetical protein CEUSTIGMA_g12122.t1 [Chlamydomonas eustigma]|eukprot:GAX84700.1 hypothetical protein CEUSTIGMA_g12122.t1 [Chlamydomonas eustigma]